LNRKLFAVVFFGLNSLVSIGYAQISTIFKTTNDTNYYYNLDHYLTLKLFIGEKNSDFKFNDYDLQKSLNYKSNPSPMIGFGGSYKWINIKLGIGVKNPGDTVNKDRGLIDIQTQLNFTKFTLSLYASNNTGYYLQNSTDLLKSEQKNEPYSRSDIQDKTYGVSGFYVFNNSRYSNRATFLQNHWQRKSAGSLLVGGNLLYNSIKADSSLVPSNIIYDSILNGTSFKRTDYFALGGNVGYAYTFVLWEHWFINYSILGGLSYGATAIYPDNESMQREFKLGATLLNGLGLGYNSQRFYAGLNYSLFQAFSPMPIDKTGLGFNLGKFQLLIAYRFAIKKHENILPHWFPLKL